MARSKLPPGEKAFWIDADDYDDSSGFTSRLTAIVEFHPKGWHLLELRDGKDQLVSWSSLSPRDQMKFIEQFEPNDCA